jgi:hypothetical protein
MAKTTASAPPAAGLPAEARVAPEDWLSASDVLGSVLAIATLAVAYPVLDLLGRNAPFFTARGATWWEPVLAAAVLALLLPLALVLALLGVRAISRRAGRMSLLVVIAALVSMVALQALDRAGPPLELAPGWLAVLATVVGVAAAVAYRASPQLRSSLRLGPLVPLIACGLFLFGTPVSRIVMPAASAAASPAPAPSALASTPPIVMIVLDELPVASLMDARGEIDADLFPTFARLAEEGVWYRNTTTVHSRTAKAVPAILTGNRPDGDQIPIVGDHPNNLFTLVADVYRVHAREAVTDLCPDEVCNAAPPESSADEADEADQQTAVATGDAIAARVRTLGIDVVVVASHVLIPAGLRDRLPPISAGWGDFLPDGPGITAPVPPAAITTTAPGPGSGDAYPAEEPGGSLTERFDAAVTEGRDIEFTWLSDAIREHASGDDPQLFFLHSLLPHMPWEYMPSGQRYLQAGHVPGPIPDQGWGNDRWLVAQAYQRHLLQTAMVDGAIGDVLQALEDTGSYGDALVIVTADHGVSFREGHTSRDLRSDAIGDIAAVPLFIKFPHGEHSGASDVVAETIDVLPTVIDVLGPAQLWSTDGRSLEDPDQPRRSRQRVVGEAGVVLTAGDGRERDASLTYKLTLLGRRGGMEGLFSRGRYGYLVGQDTDDLQVGGPAKARARLDGVEGYADIDTTAEVLPNRLLGTVVAAARYEEPVFFAVVVNGTVEAIARTYDHRNTQARIDVLLPTEALVDGRNEIALLQIGRGPDGAVLQPVALATAP